MGTFWKSTYRKFPEEMTNTACRKEADVIRQASGSGVVIKQLENVAMDRIIREFQT